jgi:hypothetical protein
LVVVELLLIVSGGWHEGLRAQQYFFILTFIPQAILTIAQIYSVAMETVYFSVLGVLLVQLVVYGDGNLKKIKMRGRY